MGLCWDCAAYRVFAPREPFACFRQQAVLHWLPNVLGAFYTAVVLQASNVATYVAYGDVALSVLMTTASTLAASIMTPTLTSVLAGAIIPINALVSPAGPGPVDLAVGAASSSLHLGLQGAEFGRMSRLSVLL